jgi:hypothetical protein
MKHKISIAVIILASMFCKGVDSFAAYNIDNLDSFEKVPLESAQVMPTKAELMRARPRVIVFSFDDYEWRGGGTLASDKVKNELSDTGAILVDRSLPLRLRQDIALSETKRSSGYKGQYVADYAITGKITQANLTKSYNKDNGKHYNTAQIALTIRITELPSMQTVKIINEDGQQITEGRPDPEKILIDALDKVIVKAHTHLKNQFAPSGYVLEHRTYDDNHIFKVSLGKAAGATPGQKVIFIKSVPDKNPLTGVVSIEQVKVAEGEITEQITDSYSFIIIKDKEGMDKIRLGDQIKVLYKNSIWDHLKMI